MTQKEKPLHIYCEYESQKDHWLIGGTPAGTRMRTALESLKPQRIHQLEPKGAHHFTTKGPMLWIKGLFPQLTSRWLNEFLAKTGPAGIVWFQNANAGALYLKEIPAQAPLGFSETVAQSEGIAPFECEGFACLQSEQDFSLINQLVNRENCRRAMAAGAFIQAPEQTYIEDEVTVSRGAWLGPGTYLGGKTVIGERAAIHQGAWLKNAVIAPNAVIKPYSVLEHCQVGPSASVGPFAHIRPGTRLEEGVRIGNFVETKNLHMGKESKASHLTYLGDASVGEDCNIGAGTITCNYDGVNKHRTTLGDRVFIGSGSQLVAPIQLGDGAFVAAGSTVTRNVPQDALAIARTKQNNKEGRAQLIRDRAKRQSKS